MGVEFMLKVLTGKRVQLELLNDSHKDELYAIAQNEKIWTYSSSKAFGEKLVKEATAALPQVVKNIIPGT